MILGIGTDIVEIERMERACRRDAFLNRAFTQEECRQAKGNVSKLAGNFAVKEAVAKVFGTGFRSFMPEDIEVLRDDLGKPYVNLYRGARTLAGELGIVTILVSISNTKEYCVAFAVGEGADS
ncbi:MAG: holo-ACP synthase [Lachnospiraceae bacterium]